MFVFFEKFKQTATSAIFDKWQLYDHHFWFWTGNKSVLYVSKKSDNIEADAISITSFHVFWSERCLCLSKSLSKRLPVQKKHKKTKLKQMKKK